MQVVASDIGATVLGVSQGNVRQYMLELMYAVVAGQLPPAKFAVGLRASGVKLESGPDVLVQLLWYVASGKVCSEMCSLLSHHLVPLRIYRGCRDQKPLLG